MCYVSLRMAGKKPASPSGGEDGGPSRVTAEGGRWPAVRGALQFSKFVEEDGARLLQPETYVTTGSRGISS